MSPLVHCAKGILCLSLLALVAIADTPRESAKSVAPGAGSGAIQGRDDSLVAENKELRRRNHSLTVDLEASQAKNAELQKQLALRKAPDKPTPGTNFIGKRVAFVVDTSGSMTKLNETTENPDKWRTVCDDVSSVMTAFPGLEEYQVVVFNKSARWLFATGEWQVFDPKTSPARVKNELLKIKPSNDTNLYEAFDLAFGLRKQGLDAVFLFSDGLPTSGPGLTPAEQNNFNLTEEQRGAILGRHIRNQMRTKWNAPEPGQPPVRVHSFGIYYETSNVGSFLWSLSRDTDGLFIGLNRP